MPHSRKGFLGIALLLLGAAVAIGLGAFFGIQKLASSNSKVGASVSFQPVQAAPTFLSGAGVTSNATTVNVTSFVTRQLTPITTANIGGIAYATIDPGTSKEENVSFTGITQNVNGTAILTGVTRGLQAVYPYTTSSTLSIAHSGGATLITSNSGAFYSQFNIAANTSTITGNWTFASSSLPNVSTDTANSQVSASNFNLVTYGVLASTSIAGAVPATNANAGIVKIATGTDLANGNTTTTYSLVPNATLFSSSSNPNATYQVPVAVSGTLTSGWLGSSTTYTVGGIVAGSSTFNNQVTFSPSSTIKGVLSFSTTTIPFNAVTFSYSGATTTFTPPVGVTSITISAIGAGGATSSGPGLGGKGGSATGTYADTPGTTLFICVGGAGPIGNAGAFCGGGLGGSTGGSGGGSTWIGTSGSFSTSTMLLIAAGGGGGGLVSGSTGGQGAYPSGAVGLGTGPGNGGTQTAGGTSQGDGSSGAMGVGGNGGQGGSSGGGGGGGCFGGGGGGSAGAGGGGGSTCFLSTLTATSSASGVNNASGTLTITTNQSFTLSPNAGTVKLYNNGGITVNFTTAFQQIPSCSLASSATTTNTYSVTTSSITLNDNTTSTTGILLSYTCF